MLFAELVKGNIGETFYLLIGNILLRYFGYLRAIF